MHVLARLELRRRWRSLLVVALVVALWSTSATAAAAGARRTASAIDRYRAAARSSDASFSFVEVGQDLEPLADLLRAQREVAELDEVWFATTGLGGDDAFVNLFVGTAGRWGTNFDRLLVLEGRLADPARVGEVTISEAAADLLRVGPGDRLVLPTWDQATYDEWLVDRGPYPPFDGLRVPVTVVGIVRTPFDLQASADSRFFLIGTPALLAAHDEAIAENRSAVYVRFRDAGVDVEAMSSRLGGELGHAVVGTTRTVAWEAQLRDAARASRLALVVLAVVVTAAGALAVGAIVVRDVRSASRRSAVLSTLGARPLPLALALSAPVALGGLLGALVGAGPAVLVSRAFPLRPARLAEPRPGPSADLVVLLAGATLATVFVAVVGVLAAGGARGSRRPVGSRPGSTRNRWVVGPLVRHGGPALAVGHRRAFEGRERQWSWAALVVAVGLLAGACTFAAGLSQLGAEPLRWGYSWSSSPELGFASADFEEAISRTLADPRVSSVATVAFFPVALDGRPATLAAFLAPPGLHPLQPVLEGRLPQTGSEVALGRRTAQRLGAEVGDVVLLERQRTRLELTVVGVVVPPVQPLTTELGEGALVTAHAFQDLAGVPLEDAVLLMALTYNDGVDVESLEQDLAANPGWDFGFRSSPQPPSPIANLLAVRPLLWWLAGVVAAFALAVVAVLVSRRSDRRASARFVLHALGFGRRDRRTAAAWEALTFATAALAVGIPAGLVAASLTWRGTVGRLGIVDRLSSPGGLLVAAVAACGAAASLAYALGGRPVPPGARVHLQDGGGPGVA